MSVKDGMIIIQMPQELWEVFADFADTAYHGVEVGYLMPIMTMMQRALWNRGLQFEADEVSILMTIVRDSQVSRDDFDGNGPYRFTPDWGKLTNEFNSKLEELLRSKS